jgi:hypothetical protein
MSEKLKALIENDVYFYTVLIVAVSVLSFGLGRLSMQEVMTHHQPEVVLTSQSAAAVVSDIQKGDISLPASAETAKLVASKKGTKYHLLTCPGAKQMNEDNKIYFNSVDEAKAAGYTAAANCKGL